MSLNEKAVQVLCGDLGFNSHGRLERKDLAITPDLAKKMLGLSGGNRNISDTDVAQLANLMRQKKFFNTDSGIGFNQDLVLRNGHHRLSAVVASGMTVEMLVSINIDERATRYMDVGRKRTVADAIAISTSEKFDFNVTSRVTAVASFLTIAGGIPSQSRNIDTIERVMIANKGGLAFCFEHITEGKRIIGKSAVRAAISAAFAHVNPEKLKIFCAMLNDGVDSRINGYSDAALSCRDYILSGKLETAILGAKISSSAHLQRDKVIFYVVQNSISRFMADLPPMKRQDIGVKRDKETDALIFSPLIYPPIIPFK
jgi:hypothetical protein